MILINKNEFFVSSFIVIHCTSSSPLNVIPSKPSNAISSWIISGKFVITKITRASDRDRKCLFTNISERDGSIYLPDDTFTKNLTTNSKNPDTSPVKFHNLSLNPFSTVSLAI